MRRPPPYNLAAWLLLATAVALLLSPLQSLWPTALASAAGLTVSALAAHLFLLGLCLLANLAFAVL